MVEMKKQKTLEEQKAARRRYVAAYRERAKVESVKLDTWIRPQNKKALQRLSVELNKPMKEVVDLIIEDYLKRHL